MTWAPTEVQKSLYTLLVADATIVSLCGAGQVFDSSAVPQEKVYPYITLNINPMTNRANHTNDGVAFDLQINVWYRAPGRGKLSVQLIQKRIDELINNQDICFDGWNVIALRRSFVDVLTEPDGTTLHGVQKFKLFLGEI